MYRNNIKRVLDIVCALAAMVVFWWLYVVIAVLVRIKLGSPIIFRQSRPGKIDPETGRERIFYLYKCRSMTEEKDRDGKLLPDERRLTAFGRWLRSTSLDELPEAWNILKGDMSVIGPRPQLVRDIVFMTGEQRKRHTVRPGLSGLAQVRGRNGISWEEKLNADLEYIEKISFTYDLKLVFLTMVKVFKKEGISENGMATSQDLGDYLLKNEKISFCEYSDGQKKAKKILSGIDCVSDKTVQNGLVSVIMPSWNTGKFIAEAIQSVIDQTYRDWELLIVDDCSTDDTERVVDTFSDRRIRYYKNSKNLGAALSRNRALREARGEWIAFLDSDDVWDPEKLERQIHFMKKNYYTFSYHEFEKIDEDSKPLNIYVSGPEVVTKRKMYHYGYPGCLTFMYSAKALGVIQIKDIKKNNDYAILLQLCKKADCYLLKEKLAEYRVRKVSISHDRLQKKIKSHYDLFRVCEGKTALVAVWYTFWNMIYGVQKKMKYEKSI